MTVQYSAVQYSTVQCGHICLHSPYWGLTVNKYYWLNKRYVDDQVGVYAALDPGGQVEQGGERCSHWPWIRPRRWPPPRCQDHGGGQGCGQHGQLTHPDDQRLPQRDSLGSWRSPSCLLPPAPDPGSLSSCRRGRAGRALARLIQIPVVRPPPSSPSFTSSRTTEGQLPLQIRRRRLQSALQSEARQQTFELQFPSCQEFGSDRVYQCPSSVWDKTPRRQSSRFHLVLAWLWQLWLSSKCAIPVVAHIGCVPGHLHTDFALT